MADYHLAQLNISLLKAPLDSPELADFVANLGRINALAAAAPGYVWQLVTEQGNATALRPYGDDIIINLSVWEDVQPFKDYVYTSAHVEFMRRRREWFERMEPASLVLWWVPAGHRPALEEAVARLELLRQNGPTAEAFTLRQLYPMPE